MWFFFVFLAVVCDHFVYSGFIYDKGLGSECLYDEDCITRHSFCKGNKICACKIGYQYDPGSDVCFAKVINLKCNEDYDCSAIQNSLCSSGVCQCKRSHVPSRDKTSCLPTMTETSFCEEDAQCNSVLNRSYCEPQLKRCVCEKGYQRDYNRMLCVETPKLHEKCTSDADCEEGAEENKGKVVCNINTLMPTCECAEGFYELNNICYKNGSPQSALTLSTLILVTLAKWIS